MLFGTKARQLSRAEQRAMVERMNPTLPISQQCRLLALPRSSVYRKPAEVSAEDLAIMALIDRHYLARPYYGSRRMAVWLATQGHHVNRKRVPRLMRLLGLVAILGRLAVHRRAGQRQQPALLGYWQRRVHALDHRAPFRPAQLPSYQRPNTSKPAAAHKIYPYLL